MKSSVEVVGGEIVIRIVAPSSTPSSASDRLIRVDKSSCDREGFELRGIQAKIRAGELPVVPIGRGHYVRLSDLLALAKPLPRGVDNEPSAPSVSPCGDAEASYLDIVNRRRTRRPSR